MKTSEYSEQFLEALPEATYVLSADHSVLHINSAACRYHQVNKKDAIRKKCYEMFGESEPCLNCALDEVIKTGKPVEKEIFRTRDKAWHLLRAFPIDTDGAIAKIGIITKDISSTKTAEQILVDFNYKIKNFIDRMPIGCILWDEYFKVSMWNPAAERIFGFTEEEARGKHPYSIIVPPDMIPATEPVKQKLQKGSDSSHRDGENITKDGQRIYCRWLNTPVHDAEGKVIAVLSMVQDITHERQLQSEAIRSAQLASVGQLSASIAHEINNPINGVINYSQILLNKKENLETFQTEILEKINKEGVRISVIVKSMLNFSRKPPEVMVPQNIRIIINEAIYLLSHEIKKTGANVKIDLLNDKPIMKCNPQQVEQVIINVVKNALDAFNDTKQEARNILITSTVLENDSQKQFVLTIANNGPHIPLHLQAKIFEPFMTTKAQDIGTGLGLGICLEIMKNHGGTINLKSNLGEYTEMQLVFPL